jgi:hypothetical protein
MLKETFQAAKEAVKPILSLTDGFRLPRSISKPKPQVFPAGEGLFSQAPFKNPIASAIGKAETEVTALETRPLTQKLQSFPETYAAGQPTKTALFKQGLAQQVDKGIEQHPEAQVALEENITAMGMGTVGELKPVAQGATTLLGKAAKEAPIFEGFKDLSLKTLEKLKGRSTVDKQFIQDLTNQADLKQPEREVLREVLDTVKGKTVKVKEFAERVKTELLPLKRQIGTSGAETTRYEQIALPDELRGAIKDYHEVVYESPIKTSAGDVHFPNIMGEEGTQNYFGHVRTEDLPDQAFYDRMSKIDPEGYPVEKRPEAGEIRRVIEVQSDLYQKGNLEREIANAGRTERMRSMEDIKKDQQLAKKKLGQYNDPTAHFRMIREEVKRAAQDGKTKLQFPTGETAMKVEGLGENTQWYGIGASSRQPILLEPRHLKVGSTVYQSAGGGDIATLVQDPWIIIDVLGDGKFKAVDKRTFDKFQPGGKYYDIEAGNAENIASQVESLSETFDISGKIDKEDPIYKFYEKDVAKYLKNKYGAKLVTDPQGVTWMEVDIKPEYGKSPVEAFSFIPLLGGSYLQKMIEDGKEEPKPVLPRRIKGEPVLR